MPTLSELQRQFNIPGLAAISAGTGGLTKIVVTSPASAAEIYLHGAHLTHWQPAGCQPVLFMSDKSAFQSDKPIRGGIPICWPWFGPSPEDPSAPMHGFLRLLQWEIESISENTRGVDIVFRIHQTADTLRLWPHKFLARYMVSVGQRLGLALEITNTCDKSFTFTEALHPYFLISDIRKIEIEGLENKSYLEKIYSDKVQMQRNEPIRFSTRTDRVYYDARNPCVIRDPAMNRKIIESKENADTTVVWNPWDQWPHTVPDFGHDQWPHMVCVEPSNAHHFAINLRPGEIHTLIASIECSPL